LIFSLIINDTVNFELNTSKETQIGRKDIGVIPDIDLGPYDNGPNISRKQGYFFVVDGDLFYTNTGKNRAYHNSKPLKNNDPVKLYNNDQLKIVTVNTVIRIADE